MPAPCGTYAAYQRHKRRGEDPDKACQDANAAYARDRRKRDPAARAWQRWDNRTRNRALYRLAAENRRRFLQLLTEERHNEAAP